uniref:CG4973-PA n=1 Tax=Haemonchus placei TaxID=6290 RepID=A0A0N4W0Y5_HAEPC
LSGDEDAAVIKDVKRRKRTNPFEQSTLKSSRAANAGESTSSDDSEEGSGTAEAEHSFAASGSAAPLGPSDQGATATLEIDTDYAADAQAQFERVQQQLKEGLDGKTIYKGQAMYGAKEAKDTVIGNASSGLNRIGPIRAPQFLRQTVRWDYAPDICKDYKETGFCTFGDSCKFLHDRSDYKHGWEIERDYASGKLNKVDETNYEINEDEDEFPEDCYICGKPFVSPVVTRCKHYFCETCALNAFRKNKRCAVCGENTGGVFNIAKDLIAKLSGKAKEKRRKEESDSDLGEEEEEKPSCSHKIKEEVETAEDHNCEVKQEIQEENDAGENEEGSGDEHEEEEQNDENDVQESTEIKMEEIEQDDAEVEEDEAEDEEQSDSNDEDPRT